jgi:cobalt/nickel transport system permease protein
VITQEGLMLSVRIAVKANAILLILLPFVATLMPSALGRALHWFKLPDKLVFLLMMTYRYLFVTAAELGRLHRAAKIRGFVSKTDVHTYRTWAHLLGMLFVRARERARRIHWAMLCRGFTGRFHVLRRLAFTRNDAYAAGISAIGLIYMAMTEWMTF